MFNKWSFPSLRRKRPSQDEILAPLSTPGSPEIPGEVERRSDSSVLVASQWQLMWWKFRRHKVAMVCAAVVLAFYIVAIFVEFIAPYPANVQDANNSMHPPTIPRMVDKDGDFSLRPFVYGTSSERNPATFALEFQQDTSEQYPIRFFVKGEPYKLFGLIPWDRHLFGTDDPNQRVYLLGTDSEGRDVFSRIIHGTRISMSIGLIGVALSFVLGVVLGGISGYYGGLADNIIQRVIEFIRSIPTIPLWLGLAAALPPNWSIIKVYFAITIILSLIGWTDLARVVRGRCLGLREEDFILAARLSGSGERKIIFRHMVPSFTSHIIAALTLAVPEMIIAETALSFLGLGLREPAVSWGVLLQEAQNIRSVATAPWLLTPGLVVVIAILSLNFLGDGLRDAADPYSR